MSLGRLLWHLSRRRFFHRFHEEKNILHISITVSTSDGATERAAGAAARETGARKKTGVAVSKENSQTR